MLKLFEVLASGLQLDKQNNIESLINPRAEPDFVNARLQELFHLLDGLIVLGKEVELKLRGAGDKRWNEVLGKRYELSQQVKTLDLRVREYLNAEARKTIPPNMNAHVRKSANHSVQTDCENRANNEQTTGVLPYAGGTQSARCVSNNGCKILHRKKISASDNAITCRERQLPNVYSVRAASPRNVRSNFTDVARIKTVVTQRYCAELVSKNRCGELRQKPNYPFVAPSSAVDKQLRVCNQRQQEREMLPSWHSFPRCNHDIAVPSATLHSPNCINNTDRFGSQSSATVEALVVQKVRPLWTMMNALWLLRHWSRKATVVKCFPMLRQNI